MLSFWQDILILICTMLGSLLFLAALNRVWPREKRRVHNDLIGWQLGILGTTYAVILGFMLYTVWTSFGDANLNVDREANALRNMYRLAQGMPQPQRTELENEAREYAEAVIDRDWRAMADDQVPEGSHEINERMWKTLMSVKTATLTELTAEDHALTELSALTEHRRTRLIQSKFRLPAIFWCVLLVGAAVTVFSASLFGSENATLHGIQVFSFTLLVTLVLLSISDVDQPFRGWVHISDYPFQRARESMQEH
jgi:Protein of unknown function (DUF4239)